MYGCKYDDKQLVVIQEKVYRITIQHDDHADSPDDWGNDEAFLGEVRTRNYSMGRKSMGKVTASLRYTPWGCGRWEPSEDCTPAEVQSLREEYDCYHDPDWTSFPVALINHGGGNVSLQMWDHEDFPSHNRYRMEEPDGYVVIHYPEDPLSQMACLQRWGEKSPQEVAEGIIAVWNQYLEGDVYIVSIAEVSATITEDGVEYEEIDMVDSCGGIYGSDGVDDYIDSCLKWLSEKAAEDAA